MIKTILKNFLTIIIASLSIAILNNPNISLAVSSVVTFPMSGFEWTDAKSSIIPCEKYCSGAGYTGGTVTGTGSKTCSGAECAYISDFSTGTVSFISNDGNCDCNSEFTCSCKTPLTAQKPDLVIDSIRIEPANPSDTDQICIYATIKNIGTENIASSTLTAWTYVNNYHMSNMYYGKTLNIGDKIEKQVLCSKYGENVQFKLDKNNVKVVIDPPEVNGVNELNESNNEKISDFNITNSQSTDWDIAIKFDYAKPGSFYPFTNTTGLERLTYQKKLNETDNLYEEFISGEACSGGYWKDHFNETNARRAKGWYAERKKIDENEYRILIRGIAPADCGYSYPGYAQGEFSINPSGNWNIDEVIKCNVGSSNKGQNTYCINDGLSVKFAAGSSCEGCCACADSGSVNIELVLKNTGIENRKIISPVIINPEDQKPIPNDPIKNAKNITTKPNENNTKTDSNFLASLSINKIIFFLLFFIIILIGYLFIITARKTDKKNDEAIKTKICLKCGKTVENSQDKCLACGSNNFSARQ